MAFGRKTQRGKRYWRLRRLHFSPIESRAFSQLTKTYPALHRLIASRQALWANFVKEAYRKDWESENKRRTEWSRKVVNFYERQRVKRKKDKGTGLTVEVLTNWVVKKDVHGRTYKVPKISPWEWYDWVFQRLPDELKWDTPRSHRVRQADVKMDKVQTRRWIEDLKKAVERTGNEKQRAQFRTQIKNLERSLKK